MDRHKDAGSTGVFRTAHSSSHGFHTASAKSVDRFSSSPAMVPCLSTAVLAASRPSLSGEWRNVECIPLRKKNNAFEGTSNASKCAFDRLERRMDLVRSQGSWPEA